MEKQALEERSETEGNELEDEDLLDFRPGPPPQDMLPSYFPTFTKECKKSALFFFDCFTNQGERKTDDDYQAPLRGVSICNNELTTYKKCMSKSLSDRKKGNIPSSENV